MFELLALLGCAEVTCEGGLAEFGDACLVVTATVAEGPEPDVDEVRFAIESAAGNLDVEGLWGTPLAVALAPSEDIRIFAGTVEMSDATQCYGVEYVDLDSFETAAVTIETTCGVPQP